MIKTYYKLTKPGIVYGNAMTAIAGFFMASKNAIDFGLLLVSMISISLVIASACVFNNCLDIAIDAKMQRTKNRALVTGVVSSSRALIFACTLGLIGFFLLAAYTNIVTAIIGAIGYIDYILIYGYVKRRSSFGTLVGTVSGAAPIAAGYTVVSDHVSVGAVLLFASLVLWQMPHFYAIAIAQLKDYTQANIPVLPAKRGIRRTKISMLLYIGAFIICSVLLTAFGYTGYIYAVLVTIFGLYWLWKGLSGFSVKDDKLWARSMFRYSLIIIILFSLLISFGTNLR